MSTLHDCLGARSVNAFFIGLLLALASNSVTSEELPDFVAAAEEAYVYGLGVNAMYRYYSGMAMGEGALNALVHKRTFLNPGEKPGSGPNVDTYYSYGWLDLEAEPYVVSLPAFDGRYYVFQLTDMYGHNFHNIGNDLYPPGPAAFAGPYRFMLAGPGWQGEPPEGLELVRACAWRIRNLSIISESC